MRAPAAHCLGVGGEQVARRLSRLIDAPLVLQRYSRLAYDCNRPPDSPEAMPEISEITHIPLLDYRAGEGVRSVVVTVHSFTPVYKGTRRTVELGILHDRDTRLAEKLITSFPGVDARLNEPYGPKDGVLHTLNLHAAPRGLQHVMLEMRNDLIAEERGQDEWAERLLASLTLAGAH